MPPMPESPDQSRLPFPNEPDAAGAKAGTPVARAARPHKRPVWARLLGGLLGPWIGLKTEPANPERFTDGRPVCYVLEDYGLSNALILERACRDAGLPSPLQPLPGDPPGRKRAYVALSRRNAGSALEALAPGKRPPKKTHSESMARLLDAQDRKSTRLN